MSKHRIQATRQHFHNAIYPQHFEIRQLWMNLLLFGVVGSIISFVVGPVVTIIWFAIYQCLLLINLVLIPGVFFSFESAAIAAGIAIWLNLTGYANHLIPSQLLNHYGLSASPAAAFNYVLLASFILFILGAIIAKDGGRYNIPVVSRNERKNRIAGYPFKTLNVIPLFMFIPGDWIHSTIPYWPVMMLNGHSLAFVVVPVSLGFQMTVFKSLPRWLFKQLGKRIMQLALIGILLMVVSLFLPIAALPSLLIMILGLWWLRMHFKAVDRNQADWYSEVIDGVRVIGIEPNTPAAKMQLAIGDVILTVNNQPVTNEDEFYRALLKQSTYCRMKVRNREGRLLITETAIFNNAPHEIGVVLFKGKS
ncbi:PDZ domain-containing protein [Nicoliella lavandulae]|uniref:PDZ domain-containing protein n=1 Tax=Nicoliella lavandulae TaxID=3082954 RepID=A0ABU8SKF3_9LACO